MRLSLLPEHVIAFVAFAVRATERNIDFGGSKGILLLRCVVTPFPPQILVATREASGAAVFLHFLGSAVTEHGLVLRRIGEQGYRRRPERPRPSSGWGCPRHEGSDRKHGSDFFSSEQGAFFGITRGEKEREKSHKKREAAGGAPFCCGRAARRWLSL
jgi:hypothetical protein